MGNGSLEKSQELQLYIGIGQSFGIPDSSNFLVQMPLFTGNPLFLLKTVVSCNFSRKTIRMQPLQTERA